MKLKQKARFMGVAMVVTMLFATTLAAKILAARGSVIYCSTTDGVLGQTKLNFTITEMGIGTKSCCTNIQSAFVISTYITTRN